MRRRPAAAPGQRLRFRPGSTPLLVSMPHVGTFVPEEMRARMTAEALELPDTDWHVDAVYDFLDEVGASVLAATHSRYVIDLNRPPDDESLYPGQDTPRLVPLETFAGRPIWRPGQAPDEREVAARLAEDRRPYDDRLAAALDELRAEHGVALLLEAHSIRSAVPRLFPGRLPDFNLGTNGGKSCAPGSALALLEVARAAEGYTAVLDGRFRGGYITRHYGDPGRGVHAVQIELAQRTYMDEDGEPVVSEERAARVRPVLRRLVETFAGQPPVA